MARIEIMLTEDCRFKAALAHYPDLNCVNQRVKRDKFQGPVFEDAKLVVKEGTACVMVPDAAYYYPLHTIVRIKETK